jgi:hypothetical protein
MFGRILLSLTLLTGCRNAKAPAPSAPGTSLQLTYPVVLIGQGSLDVRDDQLTLTTTTLASGLNFPERRIVDSTGAVYEIKSAVAVDPSSPWWRDMGTSQQAFFLELEKSPSSSFEDIQRLVLDELASPQGVWQGSERAVTKVKAFGSVEELIAACRTSWDWAH